MAMVELAQDYLKAGLLDRAEEIFTRLTETRYANSALRALLEIYVREKEWLRAVDTAQKLETLTGTMLRMEVAQFHCEMAQQHVVLGHIEQARVHLAEALAANRDCVRANVMLGDIESAAGHPLEALPSGAPSSCNPPPVSNWSPPA